MLAKVRSYIDWLENGGGLDRDEVLSYMYDYYSDLQNEEDSE